MALFGAACVAQSGASESEDGDAGTGTEADGDVARTTIVPRMRPTPADELGIVLDPTGRPYDNEVGPQGSTTEERLLASLFVDRGRLYLVDGESFLNPGPIAAGDRATVNFRGQTDLDVRIVWQQPPSADDDQTEDEPAADDDPDQQVRETILGVRIGARGAEVSTWGRFERAYQTDTGLGGVISRTGFEWARDNLDEQTPLLDQRPTPDRPFLLADVAGETGRDLLLFDNGVGAGEFVYTEGFDADGALVAIMIWDRRYPWRLAVPDGEPPPDVTEREQELIDCIEGRRVIGRWGRCN
ncbi:MAG: hypothetical protein AAF547_03685 [Actinomycetota bacterium]